MAFAEDGPVATVTSCKAKLFESLDGIVLGGIEEAAQRLWKPFGVFGEEGLEARC